MVLLRFLVLVTVLRIGKSLSSNRGLGVSHLLRIPHIAQSCLCFAYYVLWISKNPTWFFKLLMDIEGNDYEILHKDIIYEYYMSSVESVKFHKRVNIFMHLWGKLLWHACAEKLNWHWHFYLFYFSTLVRNRTFLHMFRSISHMWSCEKIFAVPSFYNRGIVKEAQVFVLGIQMFHINVPVLTLLRVFSFVSNNGYSSILFSMLSPKLR